MMTETTFDYVSADVPAVMAAAYLSSAQVKLHLGIPLPPCPAYTIPEAWEMYGRAADGSEEKASAFIRWCELVLNKLPSTQTLGDSRSLFHMSPDDSNVKAAVLIHWSTFCTSFEEIGEVVGLCDPRSEEYVIVCDRWDSIALKALERANGCEEVKMITFESREKSEAQGCGFIRWSELCITIEEINEVSTSVSKGIHHPDEAGVEKIVNARKRELLLQAATSSNTDEETCRVLKIATHSSEARDIAIERLCERCKSVKEVKEKLEAFENWGHDVREALEVRWDELSLIELNQTNTIKEVLAVRKECLGRGKVKGVADKRLKTLVIETMKAAKTPGKVIGLMKITSYTEVSEVGSERLNTLLLQQLEFADTIKKVAKIHGMAEKWSEARRESEKKWDALVLQDLASAKTIEDVRKIHSTALKGSESEIAVLLRWNELCTTVEESIDLCKVARGSSAEILVVTRGCELCATTDEAYVLLKRTKSKTASGVVLIRISEMYSTFEEIDSLYGSFPEGRREVENELLVRMSEVSTSLDQLRKIRNRLRFRNDEVDTATLLRWSKLCETIEEAREGLILCRNGTEEKTAMVKKIALLVMKGEIAA